MNTENEEKGENHCHMLMTRINKKGEGAGGECKERQPIRREKGDEPKEGHTE